jgi:hypothetical protein
LVDDSVSKCLIIDVAMEFDDPDVLLADDFIHHLATGALAVEDHHLNSFLLQGFSDDRGTIPSHFPQKTNATCRLTCWIGTRNLPLAKRGLSRRPAK